MKYEINDTAKRNILAFINRLEFKGLNEAKAAVEIEHILSNPIEEGEKSDDTGNNTED